MNGTTMRIRNFLYRTAAFGLVLCAAGGHAQPAGQEQTTFENTVPLEVAPEGEGLSRAVLCPPPGTHRVPQGDVVLVQGRRTGEPDCPALWSGDVAGGPAFAVPVVMDGAKRAVAAFVGDCAASGGQEAFAAPDAGALHAFLGSGNLYGWFSVNRSRKGFGAGITHLVSGEHPYATVFMRPNLNFEHIMNGCAADAWRAQDTPRKDPMELRLLSPSCVEIRWPAKTSTWKLDCVMRYAFSGRNVVDMEFEVTPRADEAPRGYLVFMWASYMHAVADRNLMFPGVCNGVEGWTEFGGTSSGGGTVGPAGQAGLSWEEGADMMNLAVRPDVHFTEPVYYGLVDGDQDGETAGDAMAFIMMFDSRDDTRFAVWNWGDDRHSTAWDWQYVVRSPEVGKTFRHRSRLVYKKFQGREDVLAEYRSWQRAGTGPGNPEPVALQSFPSLYAPGENGYSALLRADKIAAAEPERAPAAYRRLLGTDLYRETAAERINQYFDRKDDLAGLAAAWEGIAAQPGSGAFPWSQLGAVRLRRGETAKAAEAFGRGLEQDAADRSCLLGRASVELLEGRIDSGLALLDGLVAENADIAHPAGTVCADAARAHAGAGRRDVAVQLYRRAIAYWPQDLGFRLQLGELHQSMGSLVEALEQYRGILTVNPEAPYTSRLVDAVYAQLGDDPGRLREWQAIAGSHPGACVPRWRLGLALEAAGDLAGAAAAHREVLERCPGQLEAKVSLGAVVAAGGEAGGGLRLLDEAVAAAPDLAAPAAESCGRAAKARAAAGDLPGALTLLRRARALAPTDLHYRVALGEALEAAGDAAAALEEYRAVVAEVPDSPKSSARMDAILEAWGDRAARVEEWRRLADAHPGVATPQLHLGLALEAAGDAAGARAAWERALKSNPDLAGAREALGRLETAAGNGNP